MRKAWIENDVVRDIAADPDAQFHPEIAALYTEDVPDFVVVGSVRSGDEWTPPESPSSAVVHSADSIKKVGAIEFKLLFTGSERVGIKKLRVDNELLDDFMSIIDDPRLPDVDLSLKSTCDGVECALAALAAAGVISVDSVSSRKSQILSGLKV